MRSQIWNSLRKAKDARPFKFADLIDKTFDPIDMESRFLPARRESEGEKLNKSRKTHGSTQKCGSNETSKNTWWTNGAQVQMSDRSGSKLWLMLNFAIQKGRGNVTTKTKHLEGKINSAVNLRAAGHLKSLWTSMRCQPAGSGRGHNPSAKQTSANHVDKMCSRRRARRTGLVEPIGPDVIKLFVLLLNFHSSSPLPTCGILNFIYLSAFVLAAYLKHCSRRAIQSVRK